MKPQQRTKAIGYIRVSSDQQVQEGVSLDAQRPKLRDYCRAMDIELLDIIANEGYSASTLKRPGLQVALAKLKHGQAHALIVTKLDRLTRCVKDLGTLCADYFSDGNHSTLLSVSDSIDTRTAVGRGLPAGARCPMARGVGYGVAPTDKRSAAGGVEGARRGARRSPVKVPLAA